MFTHGAGYDTEPKAWPKIMCLGAGLWLFESLQLFPQTWENHPANIWASASMLPLGGRERLTVSHLHEEGAVNRGETEEPNAPPPLWQLPQRPLAFGVEDHSAPASPR